MKNIIHSEPIDRNVVVLVDADDNRLGTIDKLEAHLGDATLHRAISVILHDEQGRTLLQQRSKHKPLWPMVWSNTCCTHPFDGESYLASAVRRLQEEMGVAIEESDLQQVYRFEYQVNYNDQLAEHELDTVLVGKYSGPVNPVAEEVNDYLWISWQDLFAEIKTQPEKYSPWFRLILKNSKFLEYLKSLKLPE